MAADPSPIGKLAKLADTVESFVMNSGFDLPGGGGLTVYVRGGADARAWGGLTVFTLRPGEAIPVGSPPCTDMGQALRRFVAEHPGAVLRPGSVELTLTGAEGAETRSVPIAERAWHEAFGLPIPTASELARRRRARAKVDERRAEEARLDPTDFPGFLERLRQASDPSKLAKALGMLKADRFRLFAKVEADHLVGVVKSQSAADLVYSCRLAADGSYACCTQNLNICGGLRGSPCKHLLVLVVGLAQAGELDAATAHDWALASRGRKAVLDKDAMTETLLRYKGAEAGEVDWRPTETLPEDFFAM